MSLRRLALPASPRGHGGLTPPGPARGRGGVQALSVLSARPSGSAAERSPRGGGRRAAPGKLSEQGRAGSPRPQLTRTARSGAAEPPAGRAPPHRVGTGPAERGRRAPPSPPVPAVEGRLISSSGKGKRRRCLAAPRALSSRCSGASSCFVFSPTVSRGSR